MSRKKVKALPLMPDDQVQVYLPGVGTVAGVVRERNAVAHTCQVELFGIYEIPERSLVKIKPN